MQTTNITIRMDAELKRQAEQLYDEMGINMTTAINIFTKAVVREGRIPFEIKVDPFYHKANQDHLRKVIADMNAGRNISQHDLIEAGDK